MLDFPSYGLGSLYGFPPKRSIFVSYHHDLDQAYYNEFSRLFANTYGIVQDNSVDRKFDSDDPDYVMRRIREKYITGTSCTIVLCGPQTPWRKYVDWEIKATLDKGHGLIGVNLPHSSKSPDGLVYVPDRLHDNITSKYAQWITWDSLLSNASYQSQHALLTNWPRLAISAYTAPLQQPALQGSAYLKGVIEQSIARQTSLIKNDRPMRGRNGF